MTKDTSPVAPFATPSAQLANEQERLLREGELFDGLGRRRIIHPDHVGSDSPKLVSYSRVTTFIKAIQDATGLEKWKRRLTLQGLDIMGFEGRYAEAAIALLEGDEESDEAKKRFDSLLDDMADEAFNLAGGHDAADYGTALHKMVELWHSGKLDSDTSEDYEERYPGIWADFLAYTDSWTEFAHRYGAKVLMQETMLVDDVARLSGRTDIIATVREPSDTRARRVVVDIKTGKIDNGVQLSQQLAKYSEMRIYDPQTGKRTPLRARRDVAIVAHVPKGEARCDLFFVDLAPGRKANLLCERVRAARRKVPGIMTPISITNDEGDES